MSPRPVLRVGVAAGALTLTGLALTAPIGSPATAAETPVTVAWSDCEVFDKPFSTNQRIRDDIDWTTTIRVDSPTPIPVDEEVTVETEIGALPTGLLPETLTDVYMDISVRLTSPLGENFTTYVSGVYFAEFAPDDVITVDDFEIDTRWFVPGVYSYRAKDIEVILTGRDAADEFAEYSFECDTIPNPAILHTVAVYDLNAAAEIVPNEFTVRQGATIQVTGRNLLASAPTEPPAQVALTIGGLPAGSFPLDQAGGFVADVTVPEFVAPGAAVTLRAANGAKVATTQITVTAKKAKVTATPKAVKTGKKVTIAGSGFKPGEKVSLILKGGKGKGAKSFRTSVKATASGAITKGIKLKKAAKGAWRVTARGVSSKRAGKTSFKVS